MPAAAAFARGLDDLMSGRRRRCRHLLCACGGGLPANIRFTKFSGAAPSARGSNQASVLAEFGIGRAASPRACRRASRPGRAGRRGSVRSRSDRRLFIEVLRDIIFGGEVLHRQIAAGEIGIERPGAKQRDAAERSRAEEALRARPRDAKARRSLAKLQRYAYSNVIPLTPTPTIAFSGTIRPPCPWHAAAEKRVRRPLIDQNCREASPDVAQHSSAIIEAIFS